MRKLIDALADLFDELLPKAEPEARPVPVRVRPTQPQRDPRAY